MLDFGSPCNLNKRLNGRSACGYLWLTVSKIEYWWTKKTEVNQPAYLNSTYRETCIVGDWKPAVGSAFLSSGTWSLQDYQTSAGCYILVFLRQLKGCCLHWILLISGPFLYPLYSYLMKLVAVVFLPCWEDSAVLPLWSDSRTCFLRITIMKKLSLSFTQPKPKFTKNENELISAVRLELTSFFANLVRTITNIAKEAGLSSTTSLACNQCNWQVNSTDISGK